mmetsp:Transcript_53888/g.122822  ORF Transcript_53888/g.122822 Transcript_53888/m.122822 type:complete len:240 (-) Transcript_53888:608-1327(-)
MVCAGELGAGSGRGRSRLDEAAAAGHAGLRRGRGAQGQGQVEGRPQAPHGQRHAGPKQQPCVRSPRGRPGVGSGVPLREFLARLSQPSDAGSSRRRIRGSAQFALRLRHGRLPRLPWPARPRRRQGWKPPPASPGAAGRRSRAIARIRGGSPPAAEPPGPEPSRGRDQGPAPATDGGYGRRGKRECFGSAQKEGPQSARVLGPCRAHAVGEDASTPSPSQDPGRLGGLSQAFVRPVRQP